MDRCVELNKSAKATGDCWTALWKNCDNHRAGHFPQYTSLSESDLSQGLPCFSIFYQHYLCWPQRPDSLSFFLSDVTQRYMTLFQRWLFSIPNSEPPSPASPKTRGKFIMCCEESSDDVAMYILLHSSFEVHLSSPLPENCCLEMKTEVEYFLYQNQRGSVHKTETALFSTSESAFHPRGWITPLKGEVSADRPFWPATSILLVLASSCARQGLWNELPQLSTDLSDPIICIPLHQHFLGLSVKSFSLLVWLCLLQTPHYAPLQPLMPLMPHSF